MSKNLLPIAVGALILIILAGFALLSVDSKPREIAGPLKSDEELQKISLDPKIMNLGKSLYIAQCGRCHGPGGTGGIGSILNDDQWIH
mgnify:FL=1